jgi:hypothetical protein
MNPDSINASFAGAHFEEDGKYMLQSPGNKPGAPSGEYSIRIQDYVEDDGEGTANRSRPKKIPTKYLDPAKSGLTARVVTGENTFDFDLKP